MSLFVFYLTIAMFVKVFSSSYDAPVGYELIVGDYETNLYGNNVKMSICYENSKFYASGKWDTTNADYIFMACLCIDCKINKYKGGSIVEFEETYLLIGDEVREMIINLFYKDGKYLITQFDNAELIKTANDPSICLAPKSNWKEFDFPIYSQSRMLPQSICGEGIECVEVHVFGAGKIGKSCWGHYDINNGIYTNGGILDLELRVVWNGEMRITRGTVEAPDAPGPCSEAIGFAMKYDKERGYLATYKCTDVPMFGVTIEMSFNCEYVCDPELLRCPLFQTVSRCGDDGKYGY